MRRRAVLLLVLGVVALAWPAGRASALQSREKRLEAANVLLVRRFYEEVFNQGKVAMIDRYIAANGVDHQMPPGQGNGPEGVKKMVADFRKAFPDGHFTIDDVIAAGDKVVVRSTFRGTQKGPLMGVAASGKPVMMTSIDIIRFAGGKMVEHWGNEDDLGLMAQIGAITPPGAGAGGGK